MKLGYLQYDVSHDKEENFETIETLLNKVSFDIVVLPELSTCDYLFNSKEELKQQAEPVIDGESYERFIRLSKDNNCTIIYGIAELGEDDKIYNTAVLVSKGRYVGKYRKIHLIDFEKSYFSEGNQIPVFNIDGIKIGVQICFDAWFPEISREQVLKGADLFCILGSFSGIETHHLATVRAIENLTPVILANRVGEANAKGYQSTFCGKSSVFSPDGTSLIETLDLKNAAKSIDFTVPYKKSNELCGDLLNEIGRHHK